MKTQKIVINKCFGGFCLSDEAFNILKEKGVQIDSVYGEIERNNPFLVEVVEQLGKKANGGGVANLKVVEIPEDVKWYVEEYDGYERVAEQHRTWN